MFSINKFNWYSGIHVNEMAVVPQTPLELAVALKPFVTGYVLCDTIYVEYIFERVEMDGYAQVNFD